MKAYLEQIKFSFNMGPVITGSITVMRFKLIHSCKKCGMTPGPGQEISKSLLLPTYTEHFLWERCIIGRADRQSTQTNRSLHGTLPRVALMESSLCLLVQMCVCIDIYIYTHTHTCIYTFSGGQRKPEWPSRPWGTSPTDTWGKTFLGQKSSGCKGAGAGPRLACSWDRPGAQSLDWDCRGSG